MRRFVVKKQASEAPEYLLNVATKSHVCHVFSVRMSVELKVLYKNRYSIPIPSYSEDTDAYFTINVDAETIVHSV